MRTPDRRANEEQFVSRIALPKFEMPVVSPQTFFASRAIDDVRKGVNSS
jgi:hypothetical protein